MGGRACGVPIIAVHNEKTSTRVRIVNLGMELSPWAKRRGGDSNSRGLSTLAVFRTAAFNRARPPLPARAPPLTRDGARAKGHMCARTAPAAAGAGLSDPLSLRT